MVKLWRQISDLESNEGSSSYDGLTQFLECTCEGNALEGPCEYCVKKQQDSSLISRVSESFLQQGPVVTANMLMLFSILLYSGNSVVVKKYILLGGTGPGYLFLRSIITIPFFLIIYAINRKKNKSILVLNESRKTNLIMITACVSGAMRQSLVPFIMEGSEASTMGIVAPSVPLVTAVISHMFNVEKLTKITVVCLLISTTGLVFALDLVNKLLSSSHLSYYLLLLIPITKSFQVVFLKMSSDKFEALHLMANQVLVSVLFCLPMSIIVSLLKTGSISKAASMMLTFTFKQFLCAVYSVLAILFLAWRIQIYCLKVLGATMVSLYQTLRPFFTMILGMIILGEEMTIRKTVGSLIICVALVIYQKNRVRPQNTQH